MPPRHKPDPPKVRPPAAPTNLRAAAQPDGTIKVDFQPGTGGGPTTGFKLLAPVGLTASPGQIGPEGSDYTFTATGGTCGQEYQFAVAALYRNKDHVSEIDSASTPPTLSCTEPDAPSRVAGVATAQGALVSWQPPPNADQKKVTYAIDVTGPKSYSTQNYSGTSLTIPSISINGSYTFKVTASNVAGTKSAVATANLKGPSVNYVGQHAGNPGEASYLHKVASNDGDHSNSITNYNNKNLVVDCQKKGGYYKHPTATGSYYSGDMWDYIHYGGKQGYLIGYLVKTPRQPDWQQYAGLPLWECAG
jgi:hypothetical protein